jgi:hypothetical protein
VTTYVLDETCSCGATFHYAGAWPQTAAKQWREQHQHTTVNGVLVVPEGMTISKEATNE